MSEQFTGVVPVMLLHRVTNPSLTAPFPSMVMFTVGSGNIEVNKVNCACIVFDTERGMPSHLYVVTDPTIELRTEPPVTVQLFVSTFEASPHPSKREPLSAAAVKVTMLTGVVTV